MKNTFKKIIAITLSIAFILSLTTGAVYSAETDEYGTFEDGIDKAANTITPTATFMNGDFEEGLRYWGYYWQDGDLSTLATIENENGNNYVKVTKPADMVWKGIMSVPFTVEGLKNGDQLIVHFDYKTELENPQFQAMITSQNPAFEGQTNNGGNVCDTSVTTPDGWKGSLIPQVPINGIEEGAAVNFQLDFRFRDGDGTYSTCFDNIQVFILKSTTPAGCYETLDGGYVNSRTLETVKIYTPEESGYYGNGRDNQTDGFLNADFSEGLKYWGSHYQSDKYAMDNAKIVTEGDNSYVEITTRNNWQGIESAAFSAKDIKNGDKLAVLVDYKLGDGATGYCADLNLVSGGIMSDSEGRNGAGKVNNKPVDDGWSSAISTFVEISGIEDGTLPRFTVTLRNSGTDNNGPIYFDNVRLVINRNDISAQDLCIQTLDGELLNKETLLPYYGTNEDGIYVWDPNNNRNMFSIVSPESTDFFNFNANGLKYWGSLYFSWAGKAGYASDFATVTDGNLVFGGSEIKAGEGIASAKINLPESLADKEWHIKYEYMNTSNGHITFKSNDSESHFSNMYNNGENWISEDLRLTYSQDCYFSMEAGADGATATIRNIAMVYADEGGMDGLFAKVDGNPYGYDKGDANADGDVNVIDLIRMKKYSADSENNVIFLAAASFDGDFDVDGSDLGAFRTSLLG